ncbi:MAG: hypothetical protein SW019_01305 [Actinomycetota bacterium]|nr:hypothetical protein [Actinomycetota bacterium]
MDISFNDPLEAELSALKNSGQSAQLVDLTDFGWDEVHLFNEGASRERIEEVVGSSILKGKYWESASSLLVFEQDGEVVRVVSITGDYLRADKPTWKTQVRVVPWGNGAMRLTDVG